VIASCVCVCVYVRATINSTRASPGSRAGIVAAVRSKPYKPICPKKEKLSQTCKLHEKVQMSESKKNRKHCKNNKRRFWLRGAALGYEILQLSKRTYIHTYTHTHTKPRRLTGMASSRSRQRSSLGLACDKSTVRMLSFILCALRKTLR
jgi:hypothetical protein